LLDGKIAMLGAGITSTDGRTIETILDNRRYTGDCDLVFEKSWLHYKAGGMYFPVKMPVQSLFETRTGYWSDLSGSGDASRRRGNQVQNDFLTLWVDHGKSPQNAEYQYIFLPDYTREMTEYYASDPDIVVLENNPSVQAVVQYVNDNRAILAINFYAAGTVLGVSASHPSFFLMVKDSFGARIAVSEPTWKHKGRIDFNIENCLNIDKFSFSINTDLHHTMGKSFYFDTH
jgi:hyaluronate lyase